jgi:hypothetical protein
MIRFDWDEDFPRQMKTLSRSVDRMGAALLDRTTPLQKIKKRQAQQWKVNFDRNGALYTKWAPLALYTKQHRIRGTGTKPLLETGALLAHFKFLNENGEVTNDAINWNFYNSKGFQGGGAQHILDQHEGISPNKGGLGLFRDVPARPLWEFNADDREAAEEILFDWVNVIMDRYFGV